MPRSDSRRAIFLGLVALVVNYIQGLAISYSVIVDKHGGSIGFEREVGRGSTFVIRLPNASERSGSGIPASLAGRERLLAVR